MAFQSMKEMIKQAETLNGDIVSAIVESECREYGTTKEETYSRMEEMWDSMYRAGKEYDGTLYSKSGLVGADGEKMLRYVQEEESYSGTFMGNVIAEAIKMGESNACMKRIVAAPTAGSCGVLPAVLLVSCQKFSFSKNWTGHQREGVFSGCSRRLSGRNRFGSSHGGRCTGAFKRRFHKPDSRCGSNCTEKYVRPRM